MSDQSTVIVSVIIPSYNSGKYLATAIDSALNQTFKDLEVIVIDDGSTDNTVQVAKSYNKNVILHQQKNAGAAEARNNGAKIANGQWLAFLDADDIWAPTKIETQLSHCGDYVWSHTDAIFIGAGQDGTVRTSDLAPNHSGEVLSELVVTNTVGTSTAMVKKNIFFEVGGFDQSLRALQDWDLWLRIAAKYELGYVDEPFTQYRVHAQSTSRNPKKTLHYHLEVINRVFSPGGVGESLPHLRVEALASSYNVLAHIAEESHFPLLALQCALKALWYRPLVVYQWKCVARITVFGFFSALFKRDNNA